MNPRTMPPGWSPEARHDRRRFLGRLADLGALPLAAGSLGRRLRSLQFTTEQAMKARLFGLVAASLMCLQPAPALPQVSGGWKIPLDGSNSEPVIQDGTLYIGAFDGSVNAIDPRSGKTVWRCQTGEGLTSGPEIIVVPGRRFEDAMGAALGKPGQDDRRREVWATPVVEGETVYVGARDAKMYALDARTGRPRWSTDIRQPITREAVLAGDVVLVRGALKGSESARNAAFALDREDGRIIWSTQGKGEASYPAASGGFAFYARRPNPPDNAPNVLLPVVLDAADLRTGRVVWSRSLRGLQLGEVFTAPGLVLATSFLGDDLEVAAFRPEDGAVAWRYDAGSYQYRASPQVVVGRDHLYLVSAQGLHAIRLDTGQRTWLLPGKFSQNQLVSGGALLFVLGDSSDHLYAVEAQTGRVLWSHRGENLYHFRPDGDSLYVSAAESMLALSVTSGKLLWRFKTGGLFKQGTQVSARPVVFGQQVIFPTRAYTSWGRDGIPGQLFSVHKATGKLD